MKLRHFLAVAAMSTGLLIAGPASAQSEDPLVPGDYVDVTMVSVDDGHALEYDKFLAATWRKRMDFEKGQGWISSYAIFANVDKRDGEPDMYLFRYYKSMPDAAEDIKRHEAFLAYMQKTETQLQTESGQRATYRHRIGSMLLQKLEWAK